MTQHMRNASMNRVQGSSVNLLSVATMSVLLAFSVVVVVLVMVDLLFAEPATIVQVLREPSVVYAARLSLITSIITAYLVVIFAIPIGYALSRYRFVGRVVLDTIVDLPMVLPPLVIGVSLLALFATRPGQWFQDNVTQVVYTRGGIVLCQFFVAVSYGIRASKSAFDSVDPAFEHLALTLGSTRTGAFRRVALPMAWRGLLAGAIMGWARAVGVFGPLMVFAGAVRMRTEVLPTTVYLELSTGGLEEALAVALILLGLAFSGLLIIHALSARERWWGT